jgi:hypothetical protein
MRCLICRQPTENNAFIEEPEANQELITTYYGLIALDGPDDCFMPGDPATDSLAGLNVICEKCCVAACNEADDWDAEHA